MRKEKKVNLGIPKGNVHQSLGAPQEEHLAAQAKEPSCLPPACQEPPSQSRAEPCTTCAGPLHVLSGTSWAGAPPCREVNLYPLSWAVTLLCNHPSSCAATGLTQVILLQWLHWWVRWFVFFLCYVLPEASFSSFSQPALGNAGVLATVLSSNWHYYIGPLFCYLTALRRLNFKGEAFPDMHLSTSPPSQESC